MDSTMNDNLGSWYWASQDPRRSWTDDEDEDEDEMKRWASLARKALCRWMKENPY